MHRPTQSWAVECFNVTVLIQYQPPLVLTTSLMRTGGAETDSRLELSFFTGNVERAEDEPELMTKAAGSDPLLGFDLKAFC